MEGSARWKTWWPDPAAGEEDPCGEKMRRRREESHGRSLSLLDQRLQIPIEGISKMGRRGTCGWVCRALARGMQREDLGAIGKTENVGRRGGAAT